MRRIIFIALIVANVSQTAAYGQVANKDEMVRKIFAAYKNKDTVAYVKLFPAAADLKEFLLSLIKYDTTGKLEGVMKSEFSKLTDSAIAVEVRRDFRKSIREGEDHGVDWSQSVLTSYHAD